MATLEEAAVTKILASTAVQALIGTDIGLDASDGPYATGWVFRSGDNEMSPYRDPQGTGKAAIVVSEREGWTSPNNHNTQRFPTLYVTVYADVTRVAFATALPQVSPDARDRYRRIHEVLDPLFHDPANRDHNWPLSTYVVSSVRLAEPTLLDVMNGDGAVQGTARYAVALG